MAALVREAMDAGAVGFASSTSPAHNGEGGMPMPSRLAGDAEHLALIEAMARPRPRRLHGHQGRRRCRWRCSRRWPRARGRPVMIAALLHNGTNPGAVFADLDAISAANARGHRLIGQVSCCPLTMEFTLASPYPVEGLAELAAGAGAAGRGAARRVLADPQFRAARARRAGRAGDLPPLQRRMGQGARGAGRAGAAPRAGAEAASPSWPRAPARTRWTRCSTSRSTRT